MTKEKTIKITTMLGTEREINKAEFVKRWINWSSDFSNLTCDAREFEKFEPFKKEVKRLAEKSFDLQTKEAA